MIKPSNYKLSILNNEESTEETTLATTNPRFLNLPMDS